jgi:hypothetical protein
MIFYFTLFSDTTLTFFLVHIFQKNYVTDIVLSFKNPLQTSLIFLEFIQKNYDDSH